jgi:hypothetical protein
MIPKVKYQSREIPPRWFRRWKFPDNDSEGEKNSSLESQKLDWFAISYEGSLTTFCAG